MLQSMFSALVAGAQAQGEAHGHVPVHSNVPEEIDHQHIEDDSDLDEGDDEDGDSDDEDEEDDDQDQVQLGPVIHDRTNVEDVTRAVVYYRSRNFKWRKIASILNVAECWLSRWRKRVNYVDPFKKLTQSADIDHYVRLFGVNHKERGERVLRAAFRRFNLFVTRQALRDSVNRVWPGQRVARTGHRLQRRAYNVAGPHHLWHVDGHHKLIKYNFVIHGCIDGFSRAIIFLRCSDNNRAKTVLKLFTKAVHEFGLPSRIRTDRGGENIEMAKYMIRNRGSDRHSVIAGKSVHNQRIERFWVDLKKDVVNYYINLFQAMEGINFLLQTTDHICLFVLHYLFMDRINEDIKVYIGIWNKHQLRTVKGQYTPEQLLVLHHDRSAALDVQIDNAEWYGVELNGDEGVDEEADDEEVQYVRVDPIHCPLDANQMTLYRSLIQPIPLSEVRFEVMVAMYRHALDTCRYILSLV